LSSPIKNVFFNLACGNDFSARSAVNFLLKIDSYKSQLSMLSIEKYINYFRNY